MKHTTLLVNGTDRPEISHDLLPNEKLNLISIFNLKRKSKFDLIFKFQFLIENKNLKNDIEL